MAEIANENVAYNITNLSLNKSLGFAKYMAWVVLCLIAVFVILFSFYIGRAARETMIVKQQDFATLLADNLNHQIYRRFTLPTVIGFGKIALRQPIQYERLDEVVQSTIHGLHVGFVRIYGHDNTISYSTNVDDLGSSELASKFIEDADSMENPVFSIETSIPRWKSFFYYSLEPETYILRTVYPLRIENKLGSSNEFGPVMGVLEFTQDITKDMERTIRFQQLIALTTLFSSIFIFLFLMFFLRRAERAIGVKIKDEQKLLVELHQHENLAHMGRVVASIAHEIRNPLGIIRSSAELLLNRDKSMDTSSKKILQAVYDESMRLTRTVGDFIDYARPMEHKKHKVSIDTLITQALVFLETEIQSKQITIVRNGHIYDSLEIEGDKDLIYRAIYNIVSNAIQAMSSLKTPGTLTIVEDIVTSTSGCFVEILFKDSGSGFSDEVLEHLLNPFYTTKDEGTGLGLPIVNTIIKNHGGSLSFSNSPEGGACVTILLPKV